MYSPGLEHICHNFFFFWPCHAACGILVPQSGIGEPLPLAVKVQSPNHWAAKEFPQEFFFNTSVKMPTPYVGFKTGAGGLQVCSVGFTRQLPTAP